MVDGTSLMNNNSFDLQLTPVSRFHVHRFNIPHFDPSCEHINPATPDLLIPYSISHEPTSVFFFVLVMQILCAFQFTGFKPQTLNTLLLYYYYESGNYRQRKIRLAEFSKTSRVSGHRMSSDNPDLNRAVATRTERPASVRAARVATADPGFAHMRPGSSYVRKSPYPLRHQCNKNLHFVY